MQQDDSQAFQQLDRLLQLSNTLQLATQGETGPEASYSPFVFSGGNLYIFVSQLASHTRNLMRSPAAGVMLIEDEASSRNIFARNRITLQCHASEIAGDDKEYEPVMRLYRERHGPTVDLLRTLPDFRLFRLIPRQGRLVLGFGRAFTLEMPGFKLQPITAATEAG
ncbi:pyridoxamine 5'-phosphate oxidase family protein [uncultured Amphritea sp.]|uniref:HugZ family pyridoxamine 5'-phosphate oxidase n=1 Tax=uncultured Amphritea sp. TaxID=981605 RepID=UPI00262A86B6|nr:pyridoxamine 5'-phosphate oxidase family protein [uncultured Amphritea sp.]